MLARSSALLEPAARPVHSETLDEMKELHAARRALVKDRTAAFNREKLLRFGLLKRQAAQRLREIATQIAAIDAAFAALRDADPGLKLRFDSIPGIGATTAFAMLIEMPELGTIENKCAASLAGLAPIARDSSAAHRGQHVHDPSPPTASELSTRGRQPILAETGENVIRQA